MSSLFLCKHIASSTSTPHPRQKRKVDDKIGMDHNSIDIDVSDSGDEVDELDVAEYPESGKEVRRISKLRSIQ